MRIFLAGLVFYSSIVSAQVYDPSDDLMDAFGGKCMSRGELSEEARRKGADLKNIAEKIKNDASCKGITNALNEIYGLDIASVLREKNMKNDLEFLAKNINDLEKAIELGSTDAEYVTALKYELARKRIEMVFASQAPNQERLSKRLNAIEQFSTWSNSLFVNLNQNQECITKNPNLPAQVGAQMLALSSSFAPSLIGSIMLGAGQLVNNFVNFFTQRSQGKKIKMLVSERIGQSLGCAFEGMASTYCEARDYETIMAKKNPSKSETDPTWRKGIDILDKDLAAYSSWIGKVRAGSPASSVGAALDKNTVEQSDSTLILMQNDLNGILGNHKTGITLEEDKEGYKMLAFDDLAKRMSPSADPFTGRTSGPLTSVFPKDPQCGAYAYIYSGGKDRSLPTSNSFSQDCAKIAKDTYTGPGRTLPDLETDIGPKIADLMKEAFKKLENKKAQFKESNPTRVLGQLEEAETMRTAMDFLQSSFSYLESLEKDTGGVIQSKLQRQLIIKTKKQIEEALAVINADEIEEQQSRLNRLASPLPNATPAPSIKRPYDHAKKLLRLSEILIPSGDRFALPDALTDIIHQDLDWKIKNGDIDENLGHLVELSFADGLKGLIKYNSSRARSDSDIRKAKLSTYTNLESLGSIFGENVKFYMESLSQPGKGSLGQEELALFCMQTLTIPSAPDFTAKYCANAVYQDKESGIKMVYKDLIKEPHDKRVCSVYDFYRNTYLHEFKNKVEPAPKKSSDHR